MNIRKLSFINAGVLFRILLFVFLIFICGLFSILLTSLLFGQNLQTITAQRISQMILSVGVFILPPILLAFFTQNQPCNYLGLKFQPGKGIYLWLTLLSLIIIPFINLVTSFNEQVVFPASLRMVEEYLRNAESAAATLTQRFLNVNSFPLLVFNLFLMAVLPALGEELFFRGTIQKMLSERTNPIVAIWATAVLFSAIHFQFYGFLPRMLLGALLGYLYFWSNNLWLPIFFHFVNNGIAVLFYYLHFNGWVNVNVDAIGTKDTVLLGVESMLIVGVIIYKIYKYFRSSAYRN